MQRRLDVLCKTPSINYLRNVSKVSTDLKPNALNLMGMATV